MNSVLQGIAEEVLQTLVPVLSEKMRETFVYSVNKLEGMAKTTNNEYDDALVKILRSAIDAPGPKKGE